MLLRVCEGIRINRYLMATGPGYCVCSMEGDCLMWVTILHLALALLAQGPPPSGEMN